MIGTTPTASPTTRSSPVGGGGCGSGLKGLWWGGSGGGCLWGRRVANPFRDLSTLVSLSIEPGLFHTIKNRSQLLLQSALGFEHIFPIYIGIAPADSCRMTGVCESNGLTQSHHHRFCGSCRQTCLEVY